jgi:ABC-2 type transport system permease protein
MRQILAIARKELGATFRSPMALIFIGAFLASTLFTFFWVDTFFARGVADVRPLFRWMPLLLIFLVAALTMRQWSEEQRSGTLEILLTLPVPYWKLVLGKFIAVLALVAIALALTLFLPITVALLGSLDWGPVVGGYLASLLLAGTYAAIGLFVSSRTDNQIVALISSVLISVVLYGIGASALTGFFPDAVGEIMGTLSTGSRFESIERGVVDLHDLLYYFSLAGIFLVLNVFSLESKRWSVGDHLKSQRTGVVLTSVLIVLNLTVMNVWFFPVRGLRLDLTEQGEYSLSQTTTDLLGTLEEPLLVRGYFSEKTHPLLSPLVPRIRDTLREYEIASVGMLELEFIDPANEPELEAEANQVYGIRPTPFQVSGRYEAAVINSYFHLLIRYGDQNIVLGFNDLIEVERRTDDTLDVRLRNLEYDLTRSIKKVVYGFQSVDTVLAAMSDPVDLTLFVTPDTLPESLAEAPQIITTVAEDIRSASAGNFNFNLVDPDAPGSPYTRQELFDSFGLQPIAVSLFSEESFYLYMVLQIRDEVQVLYPSGEVTEASIRTNIESGLKRSAPGFLKVVGLWTPPAVPTQDVFGQMRQPISSWETIGEQLRRDYEVRTVDLSSGEVAVDVDALVLVAPEDLTDLELYAIDQFLMRGGSLIIAAGRNVVTTDPFGGLALRPLQNGIYPLLESYGLMVEQSLVMDPQNERFPVPVTRDVGGFLVQEFQLIDYPPFVDVREGSMDKDSPITVNLPAVTMNWASPVIVDEQLNADREVRTLLRSSSAAWLQEDINIQPDFNLYPDVGFPVGETRDSYPLGVSVQGVFESYFSERPAPQEVSEAGPEESESVEEPGAGTIARSPESARLVLFGSAEFVDDVVFNISSSIGGERYLNSLQLMQNAVDWGVEDLDLLEIRTRGTQVRLLTPLEQSEQSFWEAINYAVALVALVAIGMVQDVRRRSEEPLTLTAPDHLKVHENAPMEAE